MNPDGVSSARPAGHVWLRPDLQTVQTHALPGLSRALYTGLQDGSSRQDLNRGETHEKDIPVF
jgi:hypothetical protein